MSRRWMGALLLAVACGDDGGGTGTTSTSAGASTGDESSTSTSESSSSGPASTGSESSSSTSGSSSSSSSSSGGPTGDPSYPPVDGGACPGDQVPTVLPGASVCAPFCTGEGAACPDAATGEAVPTCTPFERAGGSGTPCTMHDECPAEEACGVDGTCIAVAFWACRLQCLGGELCPDDMTCTAIGTCGYPD